MKMAVVGAGPIGAILGGYLANGGYEIAFVDILKDHLEAINNNGLKILGPDNFTAKINATYKNSRELLGFSPEIIFICVKAPVIKFIAQDLKYITSELPNSLLISFQNGLDTENDLIEIAGKERTLRVVINYAGGLTEPGEVKMAFFNKPNYIGGFASPDETRAKEVAAIMTKSGLDTDLVADIKKYEWEKVILNAALSPLCAITGMTMKQAMDFPHTYKLVEETLKEGISVAKALGYNYGNNFFAHCIGYLKKAGHHKTSMHVDLENKRPTEINYINNKIVEYGKKNDVKTPYNNTIVISIKAIEARLLDKLKK